MKLVRKFDGLDLTKATTGKRRVFFVCNAFFDEVPRDARRWIKTGSGTLEDGEKVDTYLWAKEHARWTFVLFDNAPAGFVAEVPLISNFIHRRRTRLENSKPEADKLPPPAPAIPRIPGQKPTVH